MATVTTTANSQLVGTYYLKTFIETLQPELHILEQGRKQPIPKNGGNTLHAVRASVLSAATTPLTEGTAHSSATNVFNPITVSPRQFGDFSQYSDTVANEAINPIVDQLSVLHARQAALTINTICQTDLHGNFTTTKYGGGASSDGSGESSVSTVLGAGGIRKVHQLLSSAGALKYSDGTYHWVIDPHCTSDLFADSGVGSITSINQYVDAGRNALVTGAIGKAGGFTFFEDSSIQTGTGAGSVTTYRTYAFGAESFLAVDAGDGAVKFIYIPVTGTPSISDPLQQNGAVGWKALFDAVVVQPAGSVEVIVASAY